VSRSITMWYRIEPQSDDMVPGPDRALQARLYDPAWLLGRQWQLGELTGEDAASPAWVRLRLAATPIDQIRLGDGPIRPVAPGEDLEPLVEAGAGAAVDGWAASVAAGQHLIAALEAVDLGTVADALRGEFPVPDPDPDGLDRVAQRRFHVLRRSGLDGAAVLAAVRDAGGEVRLPQRPAVPQPQRQGVLAVLRAWAAWYPAGPPDAGAAWVDDRLEYRFAVAAADPAGSGDVVFDAPEYQGGRLDWHDFRAGEGVPGATAGTPERWVHAGLPTRVGYPGMPANRWWELEDGAVSFPHVEAEGGDLARLLLVEFASVYGNDWFVAPCDVRFGTVLAVEGVVVVDTFGRATLVRPAAAPGWRMFEVSGAPAGRLVVASVVVGGAEGPPIEEVQLTRDEMADLGWAIERTVTGAAGQRVDRHERWRDRVAALPASTSPDIPAEVLVYDLADEPPDHWTPLVPMSDGPRSIRLRRGVFLRGDGSAFPPLGRFLDPTRRFELFEEEVPRSGIMLTRAWQRARAVDGRTVTWVGRRARPGRGESRSQVSFDRLRPTGERP
jgi:hypothetical protein